MTPNVGPSIALGSRGAFPDRLDDVPPEFEQDLSRRMAELESKFEQQSGDQAKSKDAAAKKFGVRPFGRLHVDMGSFDQDAANKAVVGNARNGIDIRRARFGFEGEGFDTWFYRFDVDFVNVDPQVQTRPVILDAYLDTQNLPLLGTFRFGHFREPFSIERLDSTHDLPFLERSAVVNTLTPFRNMGGMFFNWNEEETHTWACGLFDENTNELGESLRDRAGLAFTGRTTWLPYYDEPSQGRYLLHLGASYSYRRVGSQMRRFSQPPEVFLREGSTIRTPNFVDTGVMNLPDYHVMGCELATVLGSLSVQGEYLFLVGNQLDDDSLFFHGGYIEAMYWLTGENRNYIRRLGLYGPVTPNTNFFRVCTDDGIQTGSGAWELTTRLSNFDLDSHNIQGGNMTNLTFGVNWYYAVRCRVMLEYVHSFLFRDDINSDANIVATRFQYTF